MHLVIFYFIPFFIQCDEIRQLDFLIRKRRYLERERLGFFDIRERKHDRRLAIQLDRPQPLFNGIADIQMQTLSHDMHQTVSLEDNHLVIDISLHAEHIQIGKAVGIRHASPAFLLILY